MVANSISGRSVDETIAWLQPDPLFAGFEDADINTLKALGIKPPGRE